MGLPEPFELTNVQVFVYTARPEQFNPPKLLGGILSEFATRYNGSPQVLPLPSDAPADIPRVILKSQDEQWFFQASSIQLVSGWNGKSPISDPIEKIKDCLLPLKTYCQGLSVCRSGIILQRQCKASPKDIVARFCRDSMYLDTDANAPLRNSTSFQIHNHKLYELNDILPVPVKINSWVRCLCEHGTLRVIHDFNTLNEDKGKNRYNFKQIEAFATTTGREANDILGKYFG